jgi:hypothetical protein
MKDYKILGTKLPNLKGRNINYRVTSWNNSHEDRITTYMNNEYVSFGFKLYNNEIYILFERPCYIADRFFMIKEKDIIAIDNEINNEINNNKNIKEIERYEVLKDAWGTGSSLWRKGTAIWATNKESLPYFVDSGLINNTSYFKPIYKSSGVVIRMCGGVAGFDLKVTENGIYHKNENITFFVEEIVRKKGNYPIGIYNCIVKDITFSTTGCENVETKLSEWINVWDKYQELKK